MKWGVLRASMPVLVVAAGCTLLHCADLSSVSEGTCGNGVVDPGEDCDGAGAGANAHCALPGEVGACHFDCRTFVGDAASALLCPEGYGCGVDDGVCRAPSGRFAKGYEGPAINAEKAVLGDLDGDGRLDVIAKGKPAFALAVKTTLHYFDAKGLAPEIVDIPQPIASPVPADVVSFGEARPASELIFGAIGVAALGGNASRRLVPIAFPSVSVQSNLRVVVGHANPSRLYAGMPSSRLYFLRALGEGGSLGVSDDQTGKGGGVDLGLAERDPGNVLILTGSPKKPANLLVSSKSVCGDAAFAAGAELSIVPLCQDAIGGDDAAKAAGLQLPKSSPRRFKTPNGASITGLAATDLGLGNAVRLVVSTADGLLVPGVSDVLSPVTNVPTNGETLLAGFDDESSHSVYVALGKRIFAVRLRGPDGGAQPQGEAIYVKTSDVAWTSATAVDFNGDGKLDIVASSAGESDVSVFLNNGTTLNPSVLSTGGPVQRLEVGDFDGDGIGDIAYTRPALGGGQEIVVAYGQRSGAAVQVSAGVPPPGSDTTFAQLANVGSDPANGFGDGLDDLVLVSWNGTRTTETSVFGSGNRLPTTPIIVVGLPPQKGGKNDEDTPRQALAVGTVPVRTSAGKIEIVALGLTSDTTSGRPAANVNRVALDYDSLVAGTARDVIALDASVDTNLLSFVAIDIEGTKDETALFLAGRLNGKPVGVFTAPKEFKGGLRSPPPLFELGADVSFVPGADLAAVDFDDDGKSDLLMEVAVGQDRRLLLSYNENGKLGPPNAVPDNQGDSFVGIARVAVATAHKDVVTCSKNRGVVRFVGNGRDRRVEVIPGFEGTAICSGVTGLAGGDVNGDGVDDLVLLKNGAVVVYLGGTK